MRHTRPINYILMLLACLAIASCSSCGNKQKEAKYMPNISGKEGDILIVIDKKIWESEVGGKLHTILTQEYPALPQSEPLFSVYNTPHSTFDGSYRFHRNIIMVTIDKTLKESRIKYAEDMWAKPQTVVIINAKNLEEATQIIEAESEKITSCFEQAERNRIINTAKKFEDKRIESLLSDNFGCRITIPKDFSLKRLTDHFAWIAYETTFVNQGLFVYKYPYNPEQGLTLPGIIRVRDEMLKENVPGMRADSYMETSQFISPLFKNIQYRDKIFSEVRGLWELKNDYMGGPFISHSFLDKTGENVIVVECFVYAPKFDKREYLRYVESILYTFEWSK